MQNTALLDTPPVFRCLLSKESCLKMASKVVHFPSFLTVSSDLFPTKWSLFIFITYMALFINQGIMVTATKTADNVYKYNTTTAVLFTELIKLVIATSLYLKEKSVKELKVEFCKNYKVCALYLVPSLLYCMYNNLAFVNLAAFDPTTYYLLLQFRVVITGIVFQILFKKQLSGKQWLSLLLLTLGCIIKQLHTDSGSGQSGGSLPTVHLTVNLLLILLQTFCSCFAGVYNEYLLKDTGADVHIMIQNMFMYVDSAACNLGVLLVQGQLTEAFTPDAILQIFQWRVVCVMLNNAGIGIVTSFFLSCLNSILKAFASALELMFTAVLCWIIFGIKVNEFTILSILIVSYATFLYVKNPVVNKSKNERSATDGSSEKLIQNGAETV